MCQEVEAPAYTTVMGAWSIASFLTGELLNQFSWLFSGSKGILHFVRVYWCVFVCALCCVYVSVCVWYVLCMYVCMQCHSFGFNPSNSDF